MSLTTHKQRFICCYQTPKCEHSLSFLHLPQVVRDQVYNNVIYDTGGRICLNNCSEHSANEILSADFKSILSLLKTCRTVYAEVSQPLYAENGFIVHQDQTGSLDSLRNLRPCTLQHLRNLKIHVEKITNVRLRSANTKLADFHSALSHVLQHMTAFNLRLGIVCNAKDVETIGHILAPLHSTRTLYDCSLSVAPKPDSTLYAFARDIATQAMGRQPQSGPFRFLDLPLELQYRILEFTELVTDFDEIKWTPHSGYKTAIAQVHFNKTVDKLVDSWGDRLHSPSMDREFTELWATEFDEPYHLWRMRDHDLWRTDSGSDFCRLRHAAYSQHCQCRLPPKSLFLVSRRLRHLTSEVLFKHNRIIVFPTSSSAEKPRDAPGISAFLTSAVPVSALGSLRSLEMLFPGFGGALLAPAESICSDWSTVIDFMKDNLNLPMLTLRMYFEGREEHNHIYRHATVPSHTRLEGLNSDPVLEIYHRAVCPLSLLGQHGLRRFFLHHTLPWRWFPRNRRARFEVIQQNLVSFEQYLERVVMGDEYNSVLKGKNEEKESSWVRGSYDPLDDDDE